MSKVLTPARRARLEKLATYLEALPADYSHFDMSSWVEANSSEQEEKYARHNGGVPSCGTSACAAGHGPAAGILVPPRFLVKRRVGPSFVRWGAYASAMFCGDNCDLDDWLFDGAWDRTDNHHYGAAARIRYVLDNGGPPPGFEEAGRPYARWLPLYASYRVDVKAKADA